MVSKSPIGMITNPRGHFPFTGKNKLSLAGLVGAAGLGFCAAANAGLIINPTFDSSITTDPNAATIEATINSAIQVYESSFADPITVSIKFQSMNSGLGESETFGATIPYNIFLPYLAADATTANDATALANLPATVNNPVNGNANVELTTANFRAIGIDVEPPAGSPDGTVSLNLSLMNLSRTSIDPNKYDLMAVASHEIDEVLGIHSALFVTNGAPVPTGPVFPLDLFRYDQNGNRSFNTAANSQAYFSLNGTTQLARFNQDDRGDRNDWFSIGSHNPQVQDAFGTPGATPNLGVEKVALDVLGYDLVSVPEPAQIAGTAAAFLAAFGIWSRTRGPRR